MAEEKDTSPNLGKAFLASLPAALAGGVIGYADAVNKTNTLPQYLQQLSAQGERRRKKEEADAERQEGLDRAIQRANSNPLTKAAFDEMGGADAFAGASGSELDAAIGNRMSTQDKARTEAEADLLADATVQRLLEDDNVGGRMSTLMRENPDLPPQGLASLGLQMEQQFYEKEDRDFRAQERQQRANDRRADGIERATTAEELAIATNGMTPEEASDPGVRRAYTAGRRAIGQNTLRKALAGGPEELAQVPALLQQTEGANSIVTETIQPYEANYTAIINAVTDDPEMLALQRRIGENTLEEILLSDPNTYLDIKRTSPAAVEGKLKREEKLTEERTVGELHSVYTDRMGQMFGTGSDAYGAGQFSRAKPKEVMNPNGTITPHGRNLLIQDIAKDYARRALDPFKDARRLNGMLGPGAATEIYSIIRQSRPTLPPTPAESAQLVDRADVTETLDLSAAITGAVPTGAFTTETVKVEHGWTVRADERIPGSPSWGRPRALLQKNIDGKPLDPMASGSHGVASRRVVMEDAEGLYRNLGTLQAEQAQYESRGGWSLFWGGLMNPQGTPSPKQGQIQRAKFYETLVRNGELESFIETGEYSRNVAVEIQRSDRQAATDAVVGQLSAALVAPSIEEDAVIAQSTLHEQLKGELEALGETAPQAVRDQKTTELTRVGLQLQKLEARQKAQTETRPILRQLIEEDWLSGSADTLAEKLQGKFVKQGFNLDNFQEVIATDLGEDYSELEYGEKLLRVATIWRTRKDQFSQGADPQAASRSAQAEATADEFERLANIYIKATEDLESMGVERVASVFPRSAWAWDGKDLSQLVHQLVKETRNRAN